MIPQDIYEYTQRQFRKCFTNGQFLRHTIAHLLDGSGTPWIIKANGDFVTFWGPTQDPGQTTIPVRR